MIDVGRDDHGPRATSSMISDSGRFSRLATWAISSGSRLTGHVHLGNIRLALARFNVSAHDLRSNGGPEAG